MRHNDAAPSLNRLGLVPDRPAVLWGMAPILFVALAVSALLWGTGHELPTRDLPTNARTDAREAVAWLAAVALLLLFAYPLLGLAARWLRGLWPRYGPLAQAVFSVAEEVQRRHREAALTYEIEVLDKSKFVSLSPEPPDIMAFRTRLRFPEVGGLRPTALGNAEAAVADRVQRRYALDLAVTWPRLAALVPQLERIPLRRAERRVDAAVHLAAGWALAAIGMAIAAGFFPEASLLLLAGAAGTLVLCATSYVQAIERTIAHGQVVESVVDLHRLSLLDALGWRRPRDAADERALFGALSVTLTGGTVDDRFRRDSAVAEEDPGLANLRATVDEAIAALPDRLHTTIDESVSRAVGESVERGLPQVVANSVLGTVERELTDTLEPTIERTLRRSLVGPRLANFDGYVSVMLLDGDTLVAIDDDRTAQLLVGRRYELAVVIGQQARSGSAAARLRIRGGQDETPVEFAIVIDSNVLTLRQPERPIMVERGSEGEVRFPLVVDGTTVESPWLWIRVTQRDRTIQNVELKLIPPDAAT